MPQRIAGAWIAQAREAVPKSVHPIHRKLPISLLAESKSIKTARNSVCDSPACDCVFLLADGLSAMAVERQAPALLATCLPLLANVSIAPIVIATQARVALGEAIGAALGAGLCVMLTGERPGLSVADSLGAYMTFDPKRGAATPRGTASRTSMRMAA